MSLSRGEDGLPWSAQRLEIWVDERNNWLTPPNQASLYQPGGEEGWFLCYGVALGGAHFLKMKPGRVPGLKPAQLGSNWVQEIINWLWLHHNRR